MRDGAPSGTGLRHCRKVRCEESRPNCVGKSSLPSAMARQIIATVLGCDKCRPRASGGISGHVSAAIIPKLAVAFPAQPCD